MVANPHDIVPAHLAVQAMRDNGYKNAAYAIAELMDNAIQADATQVELLCGEKKKAGGSRTTSQVEEIAVLDNGKGMDETVLRLALQFGNGTYLEEDKHDGIGRFGMGLPKNLGLRFPVLLGQLCVRTNLEERVSNLYKNPEPRGIAP